MSGFSSDYGRRGKPLRMLVVYVLLALVLMVADKRFEAVQTVRAAAATVLYPLQWLANQPVGLYQSVRNLMQSQQQLLAQNRLLLEENGRLKITLQRDKVNLSELAELKKLYALQQNGIRDVVGAEVVSSGKDPLSDILIIDKGSSHGLAEGDAVIDQGGLIGRLNQVQPHSAQVALISAKQTMVPVMLARTGERSLLYGNGLGVQLLYFPTASDLKPKDALLTSGLDGVYPAGIPVASVDEVVRASGTPYYQTVLSPFAELRSSRFVLVLSRQPDSAPQK